MKKRNGGKQPKKAASRAASPEPGQAPKQAGPRPGKGRSRRAVLQAALSWGAVALTVGGVGYWTVASVSAF